MCNLFSIKCQNWEICCCAAGRKTAQVQTQTGGNGLRVINSCILCFKVWGLVWDGGYWAVFTGWKDRSSRTEQAALQVELQNLDVKKQARSWASTDESATKIWKGGCGKQNIWRQGDYRISCSWWNAALLCPTHLSQSHTHTHTHRDVTVRVFTVFQSS